MSVSLSVKGQRKKQMKGNKMNKLFWIILILAVCGAFYLLGQSNKKAYDSCVAAGDMSNEVCFQMAYM